jgi:hypothetical protein
MNRGKNFDRMGMPLVQEGQVLDPSKMPKSRLVNALKPTPKPKLTPKPKPSQFSFRNAGMITGPGGKQVNKVYKTY